MQIFVLEGFYLINFDMIILLKLVLKHHFYFPYRRNNFLIVVHQIR